MKIIQLHLVLSLILIIPVACVAAAGQGGDDLPAYIRSKAKPLISAADLDRLVEDAGSRRLVLLGEASHGTHEYYAWRDSISRRLIAEKGFRFIAVEGDWASLYELNRYVKHMSGAASSAREVLEQLERWPLWMWGNHEVVALAEWMRAFNGDLPIEKRVGFYGKDVYDEWRSMDEVLDFLREHNRSLYRQARSHYACFSRYDGESWLYAQMVAQGANDCVLAVESVVELFRQNDNALSQVAAEDFFYAKQNALVVKHAERFYRLAVTREDASSWNARVGYMNMTVNTLLDKYGEGSKGIVWAHNTHIGDARFTEMAHFGQQNIGHLARVDHGPDDVFLLGFATYEGTVKAGSSWGDRMQRMQVPPAREESAEDVFKETGLKQFLILFDEQDRNHELFTQPMGNRAIGVVYNPGMDHRQNYINTIIPLRYDAIMFFRETSALTPLFP